VDNILIQGLPENFAEAAADATQVEHDNRTDTSVNAEMQFLQFCRTKLNLNLSETDICTAHRLPRTTRVASGRVPKPGPRPLIVRFNNRKTRSRVMAARKLLRQDPNNRIYINEHLTKSASDLFAVARALKGESRLSRTWTFNGRVYVKIVDSPSSPPVLVESEQHLRSLI